MIARMRPKDGLCCAEEPEERVEMKRTSERMTAGKTTSRHAERRGQLVAVREMRFSTADASCTGVKRTTARRCSTLRIQRAVEH